MQPQRMHLERLVMFVLAVLEGITSACCGWRCMRQASGSPSAGRIFSPGLVEVSWRTWELVTGFQRGECLCPASGPGSQGPGCWSNGGSWESQEHYFLCSRGNSREKRRLKVQSQQGLWAEQWMLVEDCWQRCLWGCRDKR